MNNYPKILNDDGGFRKKIKLNNGKYARLYAVSGTTGYYKISCPVCKKDDNFTVCNPNTILNTQETEKYIESGSKFTADSYYHSCKYCGVYFEPKLG